MNQVTGNNQPDAFQPWMTIKKKQAPVDTLLRCSPAGSVENTVTDPAHLAGGARSGGLATSFNKVTDIRRGILLDNIALPLEGAAEREKTEPVLGRRLRCLILMASGQTGASLLAASTLWASMSFFGLAEASIFQAIIGLILIRTWYFHTRGPKPVLQLYKVQKQTWRTLVDEGKIGVVFLGACFVLPGIVTAAAAGLFLAGNFALQLCLMSLSRLVIKLLASYDRMVGLTNTMTQKAIIVGTGENARKVADMVMSSPELDTSLVGFLDFRRQGYWRYRDIPMIGHPDALEGIVANSQIDALFWAVEPEDIPDSWKLMETAEKMGVRIFVMPNLYRPKVARVRPTYINGLPAMVYRSDPESQVPLLMKSVIDRIGAVIGLLIAMPIMLLVSAWIKLDSRGPALFKQTRLGLNGKPFTLFKFRTMCSDAETRKTNLMEQNEMSGPVFKIKKDPRVTQVGRFLRKFSIDELPQLINILRGEMSLVGPRPPLPQEVSRFEPWQHRKLSVRPGLTCLWQVNGRNAIDFDEWMRLDLQYIDNWSLWLDAKILAKTVPAVVKGSGQ
jgi:exopolysaccharide biosynthesis polyprenyl glycosylphosphotransferase